VLPPNAFTPAQARQLEKAKVRLRGIPDLQKRAEQLMTGIRANWMASIRSLGKSYSKLRYNITIAYRARDVTCRIGSSVATAAIAVTDPAASRGVQPMLRVAATYYH
jgi:hypothetical protein